MLKAISLQSINSQQDIPNTPDKLMRVGSGEFYFMEEKSSKLQGTQTLLRAILTSFLFY